MSCLSYKDYFISVSSKELSDKFKKYKENKTKKLKEELFKNTGNLVLKYINKRITNFNNIENILNDKLLNGEDLIQLLLLKLYSKYIDSYDPDKNISFSTFLYRCLDNEIKQLYRKNGMKILKSSLDDEDNSLNIENEINRSHIINISDNENHKQVMKYIIFNKIYDNKISQKEISEKFNISQPQLSRINKKYIIEFKEKMKEDDY